MNPYPTSDDDLLRALQERVNTVLDPDDPEPERHAGATPDELAQAESELGFHLPRLLRRVYAVANGGVGPAYGLLPLGEGDDTLAGLYRSFVDTTYAPQPGEPGSDQYPWPEKLLPICDWGCAIWSCLDCRSDDGPIVTASNGQPFVSTGRTLRSWLEAWLGGVDLHAEMFEPGPTRTGINPFRKQPIVLKGQGKPRGTRWP
jgi:hypothetical protein